MRLLRDLVAPVDHLRLERAARLEPQPLHEVEREREIAAPAGVLQEALTDVVGQVQSGLLVTPLEAVDHPHRLVVVLEAAGFGTVPLEKVVEHVLTRMSERRVAEVVAERDRLGQVFVQAQLPRDAPGDLRDLDRMRQAGPEVVSLERDENLRLVLQPPERARMDDAVAVPDVLGPEVFLLGRKRTAGPGGARAARGVDREPLFLHPLEAFPGECRCRDRHASSRRRERSRERASPTR